MSRLLCLVGYVAALAAATPTEEVMILFDASHSGVLGAGVNRYLTEAMQELRETFPNSKFAVASFVDKPAPYVGLGTYGGYPNGRRSDWCYSLETPLSDDDEVIQAALLNIPSGSGLDAPEAHFEAMVRSVVDPNVGWSEGAKKTIMLFTDDFGHLGNLNSLASHVDLFNYPVHCDPANRYSQGGFGAQSTFNELAGWVTQDYDAGVSYASYYEMANLLYQHMCENEELSASDLARLEELREKLGPVEVPAVKPFSVDVLTTDPNTHCREHEYPIYEDILSTFNAGNFELIIIQADANPTSSSSIATENTWRWVLENPLVTIPNQYKHISTISSNIATVVSECLRA